MITVHKSKDPTRAEIQVEIEEETIFLRMEVFQDTPKEYIAKFAASAIADLLISKIEPLIKAKLGLP